MQFNWNQPISVKNWRTLLLIGLQSKCIERLWFQPPMQWVDIFLLKFSILVRTLTIATGLKFQEPWKFNSSHSNPLHPTYGQKPML